MAVPSDSRAPDRDVCERLADLLSTDDGLPWRAASSTPGCSLMDHVNTMCMPTPLPAVTATMLRHRCLGSRPAAIGIWKPAEDDSGRRWIRDDTALHADWWALEPALARKPKDSPTRICVLGESVAAGWLHAPHITPSAILRRQLDAVRPGAYEVIDLSAVNLQPSELRNLAAASLQLDPDILLIFAGNNWPIGLPPYPGASVARFQAASEALRRGGPAGLMELSDSWTLALSRHVVDVIGELARIEGVEVIWVVPEVNLADWPRHRPVTWLEGDGVRRWYGLLNRTSRSLAAGGFDDAAEAADAMIALDGGTCATSIDLLARCDVARGRLEDARRVSGGRCTRETGTACCFCRRRRRRYRTRFREGARRWNSALVDLPDVFAKCYPDELPGRRLFLDYCHLTLDGMHLAMAAAASRVLDLQPQETARIGIAQLLRSVPPVEIPPAVDAAARFFAALYCLRFASTMTPGVVDTESIARHWIDSAIAVSGTIRDAMAAWVATHSVPRQAAPLSAALRRFRSSLQALPPFPLERPADLQSVMSLCDALGIADPGDACLENGYVDLLNPANGWHSSDREEACAGLAHQTTFAWRAVHPISRFGLRSTLTGCQIEMVVRTSHGEELAVELNGQPLASARVGPRWTAHRVAVAPERLRIGRQSAFGPLAAAIGHVRRPPGCCRHVGDRQAGLRPSGIWRIRVPQGTLGREPGAADAQPA